MTNYVLRKKYVYLIFIGVIFSTLLTNVNGEKLIGNHIKPQIINETEYWGVCIVAFDGEYDDAKEPFIYNSLLEADNWDESHLRLLFRENATRAAILDALDWLIESADDNDVVLFSGHSHGTYRRADKKYGMVPIDSEIAGIITVDELDEKFDAIQAKELCLIFDCCLSGNFVDKDIYAINRIKWELFYNKGFTKGVEGDNRVILMSTMKYGLGIGMNVNVSGHESHFSFHRFVGDAFGEKIDYNNDGFCSAEEAFRYAKVKWRPYALMSLLMIRMQIQSLLTLGFLILPFPTLYDAVQGELSIV